MPGDRRLARAVECSEERALAGERRERVGVIDAGERFARARVVFARFDRLRALRATEVDRSRRRLDRVGAIGRGLRALKTSIF